MGRGRPLASRVAAIAILAPTIFALVACDGSGWGARRGPPQRIILFVVDTLRRDHLSSYGSEIETPNLDALAKRGAVFTNFNASFHQTSMSMASLFTGRTPSVELGPANRTLFWNSITWCGLYRFAEEDAPDSCIPPTVPTLAESLRAAGYWTAGVAANQFLFEPSGFSRGFDAWREVGEKPKHMGPLARLTLPDASKTRYFAHVNRAALEAVEARQGDRFFLYVHYMDVHDYGGGVQRSGRYRKAVSSVDWAIGDLLAELRRRDLYEDSVVIVTSDHGERLGERHAVQGQSGHLGNPSFQEVLSLPLIIAPDVGRDPSAFLRTQDLFHLILEIAGVPAPGVPVLADDELYVSESSYRTYVRGRYKSAERRDDGTLHLFDLEVDRGESRDVAAAHPEVVAEHRRRMDELGVALSAGSAVARRQSEEDRNRLRALGYLEQIEESP